MTIRVPAGARRGDAGQSLIEFAVVLPFLVLVAFGVNTETIVKCLTAAVIVGFLAGGLPALRSARLSVVDGLRKVW